MGVEKDRPAGDRYVEPGELSARERAVRVKRPETPRPKPLPLTRGDGSPTTGHRPR